MKYLDISQKNFPPYSTKYHWPLWSKNANKKYFRSALAYLYFDSVELPNCLGATSSENLWNREVLKHCLGHVNACHYSKYFCTPYRQSASFFMSSLAVFWRSSTATYQLHLCCTDTNGIAGAVVAVKVQTQLIRRDRIEGNGELFSIDGWIKARRRLARDSLPFTTCPIHNINLSRLMSMWWNLPHLHLCQELVSRRKGVPQLQSCGSVVHCVALSMPCMFPTLLSVSIKGLAQAPLRGATGVLRPHNITIAQSHFIAAFSRGLQCLQFVVIAGHVVGKNRFSITLQRPVTEGSNGKTVLAWLSTLDVVAFNCGKALVTLLKWLRWTHQALSKWRTIAGIPSTACE